MLYGTGFAGSLALDIAVLLCAKYIVFFPFGQRARDGLQSLRDNNTAIGLEDKATDLQADGIEPLPTSNRSILATPSNTFHSIFSNGDNESACDVLCCS